MHRVYCILPLFASLRWVEMRPVRGKCISVKEDDVVRVNLPDCAVRTVIPLLQPGVCRVTGLVEGVVSCDPWVVLVVLSENLPKPDCTVLEVLVVPKLGNVVCRVGVPVSVLSTRDSVHVEDSVDSLCGANVNNPVEPFEALRLEHAGVQIVLKVAVVEGNTDAVEAELLVEFGVGFGEEVLEELKPQIC